MADTWKDYADAAELVHSTRLEVAGGPIEVWNFLYRVDEYLKRQRDAAFSPAWEGMRADNLPGGVNEESLGTR